MFRAIYIALRLRLLNFIDVQIVANFAADQEQGDEENVAEEFQANQPDNDVVSISSQSTASNGHENPVLAIDEWEDNDGFLENYTQVSIKFWTEY